MTGLMVYDDGGFNYTIEELKKEIKVYRKVELLKLIAKYSNEFFKKKKISEGELNLISLSRLTSLIISNEDGEENKTINENEFYSILKKVNSLENNYAIREISTQEDIDNYLLKTSYSQFILNIPDFGYSLANTWFLFKKNNLLKDSQNKNLNDYFFEKYKTNFEQFASIIFLLHLNSDDGIINLSKFENNNEILDNLPKIFNIYAKSLEELSKIIKNDKYNKTDNYLYKFNILRDFPLIRIDEKKYLIPIRHFLLQKISGQTYFDILDYFSDKEEIDNPKNLNKYDNSFSRFYGEATENLLYEFIKTTESSINVSSEFIFKRGKDEKKSSDITICEGNVLFLIQQKNKRAILDSQIGNLESYKQDLEKAIIKPFIQNLKLLNDTYFLDEITRRFNIDSIEIIFSISLTPEDFYIKEIGSIKDFLEKRVNEENKKVGLKYNIVHLFTSLTGFQKAVDISCDLKKSLKDIILEYINYQKTPKKITPNTFMEFQYSFKDYLIIKYKKYETQKNNFISLNTQELSEASRKYLNLNEIKE